MERLSWVIAAFFAIGFANRWLRFYQRRKLQARTPLAAHGQVSLIMVVSSRCAICPAQKNVVAQLRERYPATLLRVVAIDAEMQPAATRELSVMTIPTTLVLGPEGATAHINSGFTKLDTLAQQIDNLLLPITCRQA